jgi:hypothetical protein
MKRTLVIVFLLSVIVLSFGFVWLKNEARGPQTDYFNQHLRAWFDKYQPLRQILSLHYDGDGQTDYLGRHYKKILIEVDLMTALDTRLDALDNLAKHIQEVTGKPTSYIISDRDISYERTLTDEQIQAIPRQYQTFFTSGDTAVVYLMYLSRDKDHPSLLGLTYQEYGIVLFGDALRDLTDENSNLLSSYEESTSLHEFGHQLGLQHNIQTGCLMNEFVELGDVKHQRPPDVITDFCDLEKNLIKQQVQS